jgi:hypothetical protein
MSRGKRESEQIFEGVDRKIQQRLDCSSHIIDFTKPSHHEGSPGANPIKLFTVVIFGIS